jgi:hypothetical protein
MLLISCASGAPRVVYSTLVPLPFASLSKMLLECLIHETSASLELAL